MRQKRGHRTSRHTATISQARRATDMPICFRLFHRSLPPWPGRLLAAGAPSPRRRHHWTTYSCPKAPRPATSRREPPQMRLTPRSRRILMRAPCKTREAVRAGFWRVEMKAGMDKSTQALLPKAHCGSGRVASECRAYRGVSATSPAGGIALARRAQGRERQGIPAWDAATRERYMQA